MGSDPGDKLLFLFFDAFPCLGGADVPVPEIGDGADDQPRLIIWPLYYDDFIVRRRGGAPDDMDVQEFQQFPEAFKNDGKS